MHKKLAINIDQVRAERCRRSFYYFFKQFWSVLEPEDLRDNWHIEYICNELQDVANGVVQREKKKHDLVINVPPGSTKSTIVTIMFPVWLWIRDDTLRIISSSYSAQLSVEHSVKSRDILRSDKFKRYFPEIQLRDDFDNKSHYKNKSGGERMTTSTGGTITGFHGHFIILDDPINAQMANSEVERKKANEHIKNTLTTRKVDKSISVTILVMQRLHQDDPAGMLLEQGGVKHICLPAEASPNIEPIELKEKYVDGLLDPVRMAKDTLADMKVQMGSYGYAGQMQQQPAPDGGGIWKKEWFIPINPQDIPKDLQHVGTDWDLAYTNKESNSASAWVTTGIKDGKIYVLDVGFEWMEFPQLIHKMTQKTAPHYIEAKASGKSARQTLIQNGISAIEVQANTDKIARAMLATPAAEAGRIYISPTLLSLLFDDDRQGMSYFPNGSHDDLADAFAQAINRQAKPKNTAKVLYYR